MKWTRIFPGFSVSISGVILSAGAFCWSKTEETEEESTRNEGVLSNVFIMLEGTKLIKIPASYSRVLCARPNSIK